MKSIVLQSYNKNIIRAMLGLKAMDVEMPVPGDNEVIIKVFAAPVNPSDIAFLQGSYNIVKPLPAIPGFEASGTVIDAGKSIQGLIGSKVSCFVQNDKSGTWSEFVVANINDIIILKKEMDMEQAACFTVNPFTAYGMFEIALLRESKAIIQNASGGQVASIVRMMAAENNIIVIDIVRKQETKDKLMAMGVQNVLVETDENFEQELMSMAQAYNATLALDAVGGSLAGMMFNAMSGDSELVIYGGLSNKPISSIDVMEVIFNNKIISGFNLIDWKNDLDYDDFSKISEILQNKFISGEYSTKISGTTTLDEIVSGLRNYISNMSAGKLLIVP